MSLQTTEKLYACDRTPRQYIHTLYQVFWPNKQIYILFTWRSKFEVRHALCLVTGQAVQKFK